MPSYLSWNILFVCSLRYAPFHATIYWIQMQKRFIRFHVKQKTRILCYFCGSLGYICCTPFIRQRRRAKSTANHHSLTGIVSRETGKKCGRIAKQHRRCFTWNILRQLMRTWDASPCFTWNIIQPILRTFLVPCFTWNAYFGQHMFIFLLLQL